MGANHIYAVVIRENNVNVTILVVASSIENAIQKWRGVENAKEGPQPPRALLSVGAVNEQVIL